jgi:hypothetical protein
MAARPLSPFVLEKIRQRRAEAEPEETEETEEPAEEQAEAEEAEEEEHAGEPEKHEPRARGPRRGGSLTDRASKFFKRLGPTETWVLVIGGGLVVQHLMVPRGTSVLTKFLNAVAPAPPPARRLPAASYYAGNRSFTPRGPWETSAPPPQVWW